MTTTTTTTEVEKESSQAERIGAEDRRIISKTSKEARISFVRHKEKKAIDFFPFLSRSAASFTMTRIV